MANFLPVQIQYATLAGSGAALGATSITLTSFKDINGTNLAMASFGGIGYGTLEPNNSSQEEQVSFTGITQNSNGTATLTGVKTVLFISPFTETSGTVKAHPGGVKFIISNTSAFYNKIAIQGNTASITGVWTFDNAAMPRVDADYTYGAGDELKLATYAIVQSTSYAGIVNMSLTAKGIGEEATAAEINAGTQTGTTLAELIVNPKYLHDSVYSLYLPGILEKEALAGTSGTPSTSNKYVTDAGGKTSAFGAGLISTSIAGLYITGQTTGDILVKPSTAGWARLAKGTARQVITTTTVSPGLIWKNAGPRIGGLNTIVTTGTGAGTTKLVTVTIPGLSMGTNNGFRVKVIGDTTSTDSGTVNVIFDGTVLSTVGSAPGKKFIYTVDVVNRNVTNAQIISSLMISDTTISALSSDGTSTIETSTDKYLAINFVKTGTTNVANINMVLVEAI